MQKSLKSFFDEMQLDTTNQDDKGVRRIYTAYQDWLKDIPHHQLESKRQEAELLFRRVGITFNVYGEEDGAERLIPFDVIPRLISATEWSKISAGAIQRVRALNMFLHDVYHNQEIIKAGIVPTSILTNSQYRPEMFGVDVPNQIYAHIAGIDLVRTSESQFYVLEDNLRTPSGVSYMLEDRKMMMRLFPDLFRRYPIALSTDAIAKSAGSGAVKSARTNRSSIDAGCQQQRIFRACVYRSANGHRAGGRPRSICAEQCRLYAHNTRSTACRRDL
jgi:uncharacterized circularly permuted ATP-grasp superfamily protein